MEFLSKLLGLEPQGEKIARREFLSGLCAALAAVPLSNSLMSSIAYSAKQQKTSQEKQNKQPVDIEDILTREVYDSKFIPFKDADQEIAEELYQYSLANLVSMGILTKRNPALEDIWMPLGLERHKIGEREAYKKDKKGRTIKVKIPVYQERINFYRGMAEMWDAKLNSKYCRGLTRKQLAPIIQEKNDALREIKNGLTKSSLRLYRKTEIAEAIATLKELHQNYSAKHYSVATKNKKKNLRTRQMKRFLDNVVQKLSPNVMLGYNIQELLPPKYEEQTINAVAKAYFLDRILKEGGTEIIERFPARNDAAISYGPFQLTFNVPNAIKQKNFNSYVSKDRRVPLNMKYLNSLQQHANSAAMFAYYNWLDLGAYLGSVGLLAEFNNGFESLGEREQQILIAGITACMHNQPVKTKRRAGNYLDRKSMDKMHYSLYSSLNKQLAKYYKSAAEAYLIMKVFDKLDDRYSSN